MYQSLSIKIGNVGLGGENPIRIQSMTTTNTLDTVATVDQVVEFARAGCDFVRITTQSIKEAQNLINIKRELQKLGVKIPLIADVHYNHKVAEIAARIVEKVRINPGNYADLKTKGGFDKFNDNDYVLESIAENLRPLIKICKQYKTVIRIGVNHGSLSERILYNYGNTAQGMVESIMEFVQVCNKLDYHNLVLSLKASNVITMIEANMLLVDRLSKEELNYPIHLGVTEAGSEEEGRIKSAAGIGYLLVHGIGDTIRVSLTEDPLKEIPVAKKLVDYFGNRKDLTKEIESEILDFPQSSFKIKPPLAITSKYSSFSDFFVEKQYEFYKTSKVGMYNIHKFSYPGLGYNDLLIRATVEATVVMLKFMADGIWLENADATTPDSLAKLTLSIFQVLGLRIIKTEFIACPTCGRSAMNVIIQLEKVKKQTSHLPGLKIAVMGCSVNGPGEMADAHYGCVGTGIGKVNIYKGGKVVKENVPQEIAVDGLINIIKKNNDWKEIE